MIESVQVRQRGAYDFEANYDNLCALQNSCPMPAIKAHLSSGVLDINGDRVRSTDWIPILNTLRINKSLNFVAVRSYFQQPVDENGEISREKQFIWKRKTPAVRSKEITYRLCKSLRECLSSTPALNCLELQGLPLRQRDLVSLAKGLVKNTTLNHLSLEYCRIGDEGLELMCRAIKNSTTISSVNFSGCGLSWKGAEILSKIIRHQAMKRHNEAWRDSLRYRRPDLDRMSGIRRITVNGNTLLGDQGAMLFADALKDDLWLKALDLQQCGLSNVGARALLDVLRFNTTVVVLDVRQNPLIDQLMLQSILEQVMINCNGHDTEYKWIKAEHPQDPASKVKSFIKKRRTKTLDSAYGRKTTIKLTPASNRKRSKTVSGPTRSLQPLGVAVPNRGIPWRTAMRAVRGYPAEHTPGRASAFENSELSTPTPLPPHPTPDGPSIIIEQSESAASIITESFSDSLDDRLNCTPEDVKQIKEQERKILRDMKIELEQLKLRLAGENSARQKAEQRMIDLNVENNRLRLEVEELKAAKNQGLMEDDSVLDSIESSFKQFHAFLDMLRNAGFGELISLAGLDKNTMPFADSAASQRQVPGPRYGMGDMGSYPGHGIYPTGSDIRSRLDGPPNSTTPGQGYIPIQPQSSSIYNARPHFQQSSTYTTGSLHGTEMSGVPSYTHPAGDSRMSQYSHSTAQAVRMNVVPENYIHARDPTMQGAEMDENKPPISKTDELYEKLKKETSHVLTQVNTAEAPVHKYHSHRSRSHVHEDQTLAPSTGAGGFDNQPVPIPRHKQMPVLATVPETVKEENSVFSEKETEAPVQEQVVLPVRIKSDSSSASDSGVRKKQKVTIHMTLSDTDSVKQKSLGSSEASYKSAGSASKKSEPPATPSPVSESDESYRPNIQPINMLEDLSPSPTSSPEKQLESPLPVSTVSPQKQIESSVFSEPISEEYEDSFEHSITESDIRDLLEDKGQRSLSPEEIVTDEEF